MLKSLFIQNYALIEHLEIEFPNGLVIITGETGAGKSILLGAISLLLGGRADATALSSKEKNCVVEALFEQGGKERIVRRVISPSGRSRCFIDDEPVSLGELSQLSSTLIDIHEQHTHILLGEKEFQLKVLDLFSDNGALLLEYRQEYELLLKLKAEQEQLQQQIEKALAEQEFKEFRLQKLQQAALKEGELEELEREQLQLSNAEELRAVASEAASLLDGAEVSTVQHLKRSAALLQKQSAISPSFEELSKRLESCRIECRDIAQELERYAESISLSPKRLEQVEQRMGEIYSLLKRFNAESVEELISMRDSLNLQISDYDRLLEQRQNLESSIAIHTEKRNALAEELSKKRNANLKKLSDTLQSRIRELEMPAAKFTATCQKIEDYTPYGREKAEFLFSANSGIQPVALQKVASGGELSRIMLCVKELLASYQGMPTLIFDEIDVGVSGSIADKMGQMIGQMGERMQIFAITHLPQVASKGKNHIVVYKQKDEDGVVRTRLKYLKGKERVMEIARLLSGEITTNEAIANAKVLLGKA
ncbi:MAG: DNA repair protein RecN [Bacteroidales bacterium]|nr:DNA repair protein RecN [Bacteroidales bacterium]